MNILVHAAAAAAKSLQSCLCDPTRLLRLQASLGKHTGVGCHFLLQFLYMDMDYHITHFISLNSGLE